MKRTFGTERDFKKMKELRIPMGCGPSRGDSAEKRNSKARNPHAARADRKLFLKYSSPLLYLSA